MSARLSALFSASRLAGPCAARWRARLSVARRPLLKFFTKGWLIRQRTSLNCLFRNWSCLAALSSETFTAALLRSVRGATTRLSGFGSWSNPASLRLTLLRWWRGRSEGLNRCRDRCARGASCGSRLRSSTGSCWPFASFKWGLRSACCRGWRRCFRCCGWSCPGTRCAGLPFGPGETAGAPAAAGAVGLAPTAGCGLLPAASGSAQSAEERSWDSPS